MPRRGWPLTVHRLTDPWARSGSYPARRDPPAEVHGTVGPLVATGELHPREAAGESSVGIGSQSTELSRAMRATVQPSPMAAYERNGAWSDVRCITSGVTLVVVSGLSSGNRSLLGSAGFEFSTMQKLSQPAVRAAQPTTGGLDIAAIGCHDTRPGCLLVIHGVVVFVLRDGPESAGPERGIRPDAEVGSVGMPLRLGGSRIRSEHGPKGEDDLRSLLACLTVGERKLHNSRCGRVRRCRGDDLARTDVCKLSPSNGERPGMGGRAIRHDDYGHVDTARRTLGDETTGAEGLIVWMRRHDDRVPDSGQVELRGIRQPRIARPRGCRRALERGIERHHGEGPVSGTDDPSDCWSRSA